MTDVTLPIVLDENGDLSMFLTIEAACLAVEAVDVANEEYEGFDALGRTLTLSAHGERVSIEVNINGEPEPTELAQRLRSYLNDDGVRQRGIEISDDAALPELVHALMRYQYGVGGPAGYGTQNLRGLRTRVGWERHGGRGVLRISATWIPWNRHQGRGRIELIPNGPELPR
ncbi:hypothetical protein V6245_01535 [Salinibacterium amurskyense]|uniref:hypothetical protein n=1 Tax=Salinibacterium amurskyense TaxID=205941 RepID=UPI00311DFE16